jgi:hypothetical protein
MKLRRILNELNNNISDFGDIKPTKSVDDMIQNLFSIAGSMSNRKMVQIKAFDYINQNGTIAKEFLAKYRLSTKEEFFSYMTGLQNKARSLVNKNNNDFRKYWQTGAEQMKLKVDDIERMALIAADEMDRKIANI